MAEKICKLITQIENAMIIASGDEGTNQERARALAAAAGYRAEISRLNMVRK